MQYDNRRWTRNNIPTGNKRTHSKLLRRPIPGQTRNTGIRGIKKTYNRDHEETQKEYKRENHEKPITEKEMEYTIKRLKRNKSLGPDKIPNEIFIEANKETKQIYQEIMNTVYKEEDIPERWQEGEIKRLYTRKGQKGKCSNERGITLASNVGKVFERIINVRVKKGLHNRSTRRRHPWKRYCRPPSGPKRSSQPNTEEGKNSIHDIVRRTESIWQSLARRHPIRTIQKRSRKKSKSRNNQKTEHGTHSTNPNQIWAHKKNNDKRQHTARRSHISHRICNHNGWNNQRYHQKWHGTRTKK